MVTIGTHNGSITVERGRYKVKLTINANGASFVVFIDASATENLETALRVERCEIKRRRK